MQKKFPRLYLVHSDAPGAKTQIRRTVSPNFNSVLETLINEEKRTVHMSYLNRLLRKLTTKNPIKKELVLFEVKAHSWELHTVVIVSRGNV